MPWCPCGWLRSFLATTADGHVERPIQRRVKRDAFKLRINMVCKLPLLQQLRFVYEDLATDDRTVLLVKWEKTVDDDVKCCGDGRRQSDV